MERIPETATVKNEYYITRKTINAEATINKLLWGMFIILMVSVLATFFVTDLPEVVLSIRQMAIDGVWIMISCYSSGELLKRIFRNKGRSTDEYKDARKKANEALDSLTAEELLARQEYCTAYENQVYEQQYNRLLMQLDVDKETFAEKYALLSKKELKEKYPELTKGQRALIAQLNHLKRPHYDPSFFLSTFQAPAGQSPSEMHNADKEDLKNMGISGVLTLFTSFCAVTFAGDLIFSFSAAVLLSAIVKIAVTAIFGAIKATFGWNLSMRTDIARYTVIVKECANLKNWYKINKANA